MKPLADSLPILPTGQPATPKGQNSTGTPLGKSGPVVPLTIRGEQRPSPTAQIRDLAIQTETHSAIDWLQRLLDGWQPTHHLEAATIEQIPSILAEIDRLLQPAGQTAAGTELDRLFSVLPMPRRHEGAPDPIEIWLELVEAYPTDAIRRVFELRKLRVKASVAMAAHGAT